MGKFLTKVLIIQGMADLPDMANKAMAKILGAEIFDPEWLNSKSDLEKVLKRLEEKINDLKIPVVLVGISAGAGLALSYLSRNSGTVSHIYSVAGVLNPHPETKKEKFPVLLKSSRLFGQMVKYLYKWLQNPDVVELYGLQKRVTAYVSASEGGDGVLPEEVMEPWWANIVEVGEGHHLEVIGKSLFGEIRNEIKRLEVGG